MNTYKEYAGRILSLGFFYCYLAITNQGKISVLDFEVFEDENGHYIEYGSTCVFLFVQYFSTEINMYQPIRIDKVEIGKDSWSAKEARGLFALAHLLFGGVAIVCHL